MITGIILILMLVAFIIGCIFGWVANDWVSDIQKEFSLGWF